MEDNSNLADHEAVTDLEVGISIKNLTKIFGQVNCRLCMMVLSWIYCMIKEIRTQNTGNRSCVYDHLLLYYYFSQS